MIDGALMRDTRMVERKKTGLVKARKRVSHSPTSIHHLTDALLPYSSGLGSNDETNFNVHTLYMHLHLKDHLNTIVIKLHVKHLIIKMSSNLLMHIPPSLLQIASFPKQTNQSHPRH